MVYQQHFMLITWIYQILPNITHLWCNIYQFLPNIICLWCVILILKLIISVIIILDTIPRILNPKGSQITGMLANLVDGKFPKLCKAPPKRSLWLTDSNYWNTLWAVIHPQFHFLATSLCTSTSSHSSLSLTQIFSLFWFPNLTFFVCILILLCLCVFLVFRKDSFLIFSFTSSSKTQS